MTASTMDPTRRAFGLGLAGGVLAAAGSAHAAPVVKPPRFLWGTAISGHQSEGNNTASDCWYLENHQPTAFAEPSGDACDSYHRWAEDLDIARTMGLNCYRFGIEWSRIEPEPGRVSIAELDRYARVLEGCRERGLMPMVTFNHFTVPLWFAERGGFEAADAADLFARFCDRTARRLGPLIGMASTFNEANIVLLRQLVPRFATEAAAANARAMIAAARTNLASQAFSSLLFGDPERVSAGLLAAHAKGFAAIKAARGDLPVGVTLSMQEIEGVGSDTAQAAAEALIYGDWLAAARAGDFVGVQTYTRLRVGPKGLLPPPEGAELTAAGYEYRPQAVEATIRYAHERIGRPIYLTETGIATDDDRRRVAFIDDTVAAVGRCIATGIPVHGYLYWSLLDNFEWTAGYDKRFGLVAVDRMTFRRTTKPSAMRLAMLARRYSGGPVS